MQILRRIILVLAVVAVAYSPVLAQESQQRQQEVAGGMGDIRLFFYVRLKAVQDDLKLTEEQTKKIKELDDKMRRIFQDTTNRREALEKAKEQLMASEKAVAEILKPEQLKRVKQIHLQLQWWRALSNPEVATALKLTDEQKDKLKSIREEARKARGPFVPLSQRSEEEQKKMEEDRKATNEKMINVLTDEQKKKLKELTGKPFKGEIRPVQNRQPQESQP